MEVMGCGRLSFKLNFQLVPPKPFFMQRESGQPTRATHSLPTSIVSTLLNTIFTGCHVSVL